MTSGDPDQGHIGRGHGSDPDTRHRGQVTNVIAGVVSYHLIWGLLVVDNLDNGPLFTNTAKVDQQFFFDSKNAFSYVQYRFYHC